MANTSSSWGEAAASVLEGGMGGPGAYFSYGTYRAMLEEHKPLAMESSEMALCVLVACGVIIVGFAVLSIYRRYAHVSQVNKLVNEQNVLIDKYNATIAS